MTAIILREYSPGSGVPGRDRKAWVLPDAGYHPERVTTAVNYRGEHR